ncbi:transmembrane protein 151B-like isoform X2 [Limulus polyphemus]|uniref:Transmembrane protein 151B-like isoform X2 n=1 Tax=Limulus polyphemus TaxID=6850 RepID=A0ABM1T2P7_LIMPO|nr:transmembrane protein 151B-like isoform X2 [Limulus polyphemus]
MSASAEEDSERPLKPSLCQRRDPHLKCLVLTLSIFGCLGAVTWCRLTEVTRLVVNFQSFPITTRRNVSPCDEGYIYIPVAFLAMLYLVYLVECWHCSTRLELTYKVDVNDVYEQIQQMREAQPVIWWKAVCYHYVRRTRQVTRYRNGDAYTTTQIYYERINTHVAGSCFSYTHCGVKDISNILVDLEKYPATKIRFSKGFAFANLEAASEFEDQRTRFFQTNERYDDYLEMREGLDLIGVNFQEYMIAFADPEHLPWYVSNFVFWTCSLLLLSWPLRILIECQTAYVHYQVTKLFGVNYLTPASADTVVSNRLSRGSTLDSSELEGIITNNFTVAPSYSEALLLEGTTGGLSLPTDSNGNIPNEVFPVRFSMDTDSRLSLLGTNRSRGSREFSRTFLRTSNNRSSWTAGTGRSPPSRPALHTSISRTSLQNGQTVFQTTPLSPNDGSVWRRNSHPNQNTTRASPPPYEEALLLSRPVFLPLRRSNTERDLYGDFVSEQRISSRVDNNIALSMETADSSRINLFDVKCV